MATFAPKHSTIDAIRMGEQYVYELPDGTTGQVDAAVFDLFFQNTAEIAPMAPAGAETTGARQVLGQRELEALQAAVNDPGRTVKDYQETGDLTPGVVLKVYATAATSLIDKGLLVHDGKQRNRCLFPTQRGREVFKLKEIKSACSA